MGNEVEARTQCVRDHLQRPDYSDWQLTNARIRSTVYLTDPQGQEILEITPTVSWSSNISGAWTGSDGGQNPTLTTIHIDPHD
jgi:hypothetical protein